MNYYVKTKGGEGGFWHILRMITKGRERSKKQKKKVT